MQFGLTCQQPCYKVTLDSEKGRMDRARKMGEIMHQGSNGKNEEERNAIHVHVCTRTTEKKRDRTRQVKMGPWNGGLRLSLRYSYVWEKPGGSSWQFLSIYLCAWAGDAEREREREQTHVHIEVGLAGHPSMIQPHLSSPIRPLWPTTHTHTHTHTHTRIQS